MIDDFKRWTGWRKARTLNELAVSRTAYYRWRRGSGEPAAPASAGRARPAHAILPEERDAIIAYAKTHASPRHRALAWQMVDEDVAYVSPSTVYRILRKQGLVPTWRSKRRKRYREESEKARAPDVRWQSDIRQVNIEGQKYYLIVFIDEYSRYVVHHELMCWLDRHSVSFEAQRAIEALDREAEPVVQTDNGSGYISDEFKRVLRDNGFSHVRIHPHCPEENGIVERVHRTLGEVVDDLELESLEQARPAIAKVVSWYNDERLHSGLKFLRPIDYYRGDPEQLLEARRRKLAQARHRRKEKNLGIQQRTVAFEAMNPEVRHSLIFQPFCANS